MDVRLREWLRSLDLEVHAEALEREGVTLAEAGALQDAQLRELGVSRMGERVRFLEAAARLRSGGSGPPLGAAPTRLGAWTLQERVGAGGMGTVYRARRDDGLEGALKVLHAELSADGGVSERFRRESEVLRRLDHAGIVKSLDAFEEGGLRVLVMEWIPGRTLTQVIGRETGPIPWERARGWAEQLCRAVAYAHGQGVVHRDLKPSNVQVGPDGRLKVLDFGIARQTDGTPQTKTGQGLGTVDYMAPEQFTGAAAVDARADVYALGMTLYEMLAGRLPWEPGTNEYAVMRAKESGALPPPTAHYPHIPPEVVGAVMSALAPDPSKRPASVEALWGALEGRPLEGQAERGAPSSGLPHASDVRVSELRVGGNERVGIEVLVSEGVLGFGRRTERREVALSVDMVRIPPCRYLRGSPPDEPGRSGGEQQHEVLLTRAFAIARTPVTQSLWQAVMGVNPALFQEGADAPERPVERVSWYDAVRFCNALSARAGLRAAYRIGEGESPSVERDAAADGFRLPTEAEWECAARGGQSYVYAGSSEAGSVAWTSENSGGRTHAVCGKGRNGFGLCDMSGNVWEWTSDWYGPYPSGSVTDPVGPSSGAYRVCRGGSWLVDPRSARVAIRNRVDPVYRGANLGLRLARTVP
jgi:serine/threonine protein kinase